MMDMCVNGDVSQLSTFVMHFETSESANTGPYVKSDILKMIK